MSESSREPVEVWRERRDCPVKVCRRGVVRRRPDRSGGFYSLYCNYCNGSGYVPGDLALVVEYIDGWCPEMTINFRGEYVGRILWPPNNALTAKSYTHDCAAGHDNPETAANMLLVGLGLRRAT